MPTSRSSTLTTGRLLRSRALARTGLLASAAATVAVAVATVCLVLAWLARAVAVAGDPPPPGVAPEDVADQVDAGAAALVSAAPALVLLVAILAATAVAQLARLIAAAREHETATIRARGFSRTQAWVTDAAEGLSAALAGAAAGVLLAMLVVALAGGSPADALAQWPWALGVTMALAAVFAVSLRRGERHRTSTRGARATTGALVAIVLLASALVIWQLPLARGEGFDPVVAMAPAVVLMAGALVALAVFGAGASAWSRPAAANPALAPGYPARQVARRLPIYAVAVLLVALTVAQAVFASAYSATWTAMTTDSAAVRAGADLRVDTAPQSAAPDDVAAAAAVDGVDAASPALATPLEIGELDAQLIAVPSEAIEPVVTSAGGIIDKEALTAAGTPGDGLVTSEPVPLAAGVTGLRVRADLAAGAGGLGSVVLAALLLDATGAPARVVFEGDYLRGDRGDTIVLAGEAELPAGAAPWRLVAIEAGAGPIVASVNLQVTLTELEAVGQGTLDVAGAAALSGDVPDAVMWLADGGVRAEGADAPPVAAAVTRTLAGRLGIGIGDPLEFRYAGTGRRGAAVVSSLTDAVPGATSPLALFVPLETLLTSQLQRGTSIVPPNAVWAAGDPSADDELSAALGDRPVTTAAPGVSANVVGALVPGWWIATAGAAVLSLVAAFAIVQTLALARRRELGVLRALGVTARRQSALRAAELGGVFGAAVVLGAAAGALVSWLVVPELVRAVTPGILPLAGGVDVAWTPLIVTVSALAAGLAAIVLVAAAGVGRVARAATVGEEAR